MSDKAPQQQPQAPPPPQQQQQAPAPQEEHHKHHFGQAAEGLGKRFGSAAIFGAGADAGASVMNGLLGK